MKVDHPEVYFYEARYFKEEKIGVKSRKNWGQIFTLYIDSKTSKSGYSYIMARPLRIQFPGACYHITCRGIERRDIYKDSNDRGKFLTLLFESTETYQVTLHAYILMKNHFHLLIQTRKANCSEFMRYLNICYTGWFNWRHKRCGNLYQGRYHAFLIDADSYLLEVSRYLHLNPIRVRKYAIVDHRQCWRDALAYRWSSLAGYVSKQHAVQEINYDFILSMVGSRPAYRYFVRAGLKRDLENPFKKVQSRIILGNDEFIKEIKQYLKNGSAREQPSYRGLFMGVLKPEVLFGILKSEKGINEEQLGRRGDGVMRGIVAELLYKYCEINQRQIGSLLGGIDYVSVHQFRRRFRQKMKENKNMRKKYGELEARIKHACTL